MVDARTSAVTVMRRTKSDEYSSHNAQRFRCPRYDQRMKLSHYGPWSDFPIDSGAPESLAPDVTKTAPASLAYPRFPLTKRDPSSWDIILGYKTHSRKHLLSNPHFRPPVFSSL
ncbi:hypothetical protein PAXRUDRAFT_836490 [Paxillus rubicundulus Ve08.2h10]|uniref:Uncharacterized protein n=1 Tax=Paxillus rubicundulus Ve08.2h10 TaxID=930991 RepID=A0A0D0CNK5_9AGAM|nr:hypothetical protein PAXRUDRAFT_836490 [Paxillus rubicundulus Ve08.2h10]